MDVVDGPFPWLSHAISTDTSHTRPLSHRHRVSPFSPTTVLKEPVVVGDRLDRTRMWVWAFAGRSPTHSRPSWCVPLDPHTYEVVVYVVFGLTRVIEEKGGAWRMEGAARGGGSAHYEQWLERRAKRARPTGFAPRPMQTHVSDMEPKHHPADAMQMPHKPPPFVHGVGNLLIDGRDKPGMWSSGNTGTRHARRVYVGGIQADMNEEQVGKCIAQALHAVGGAGKEGEQGCVINVYVNRDKKFAFVEFATVEAASNALALDGLMVQGIPVRMRRPNDYNPVEAQGLGPTEPNPNLNLEAVGLQRTSSDVESHPDRIFVGGLPHYLTEAQGRELLEAFGKLKHFDLVMDRDTGNSRGYAFALYEDTSVTDTVCEHLNGMDMGGKSITVRRASQRPPGHGGPAPPPPAGVQRPPLSMVPIVPPSRAVVLSNMVTDEQLMDDQEYNDILEDVLEECKTFGEVLEVFIPRPSGSGTTEGLGKIFVHYENLESALKAKQALHNRMFDGKQVDASFFDEQRFLARALE